MDFQAIDGTKLRELVSRQLVNDENDHSGDFFLNPGLREKITNAKTRPAAVLIPFVERKNGLNVILTKRTEHLKSHSGQIAFPGGKIDETDKNAEDAALREAEEEIALERRNAEVIGRLPDYYTGSGFRVLPVLSIISKEAKLRANPDEVDYIFEVPFSFLMDDSNHIKASRMFQGRQRFYLEMPYEGHYIWGVTAGIIRLMHDRLKGI